MFDKGFLGDLFDFNNDGKLDMFEQAADFAAFQQMIKQAELKFMSDDERRGTLEDAGLDPDDYDF